MQLFNSLSVFSNDFEFIESCLKLDIKNKNVFVERDKFSLKLKSLSEKYFCIFYEIDNETLDFEVLGADIGFMFGFGIKLTEAVINKHANGIINAHPGSLKLYRGRHPIGWALIERELEITLTFHKITKDFDLGIIIKEVGIQVDKFDTEKTLLAKVRLHFSEVIFKYLLKAASLKINHEIVKSGRYLPSLQGKFEDIQSKDFASNMLIGISRAKFDYGGIFVNSQRVGLLYDQIDKPKQEELTEFLCSDKRYVYAIGEKNEQT